MNTVAEVPKQNVIGSPELEALLLRFFLYAYVII